MPDPVFTNEELQTLNGDATFQRTVENDRELSDLFNPPPDEADEREDTARALGMAYRIAGVTVPPPTIGVFRLLSMVGSEFMKAERKFEDLSREITLALFVMHYRDRAVAPVCGQFRFRAALDRYRKHAETSPEHLARMLDAERQLAAELACFDAALARFSATHFRPAGKSITAIVVEIDHYLNAALTGLDLLPQLEPADGEKKTSPAWDNAKEALFLAAVWEVAPGIAYRDALWSIPCVTLSNLYVRGLAKRGHKGIGKRPKSELCMARLHHLMITRLRELKLRQ